MKRHKVVKDKFPIGDLDLTKNKPLTSIVMVAYDLNQTMRNITLTAVESIIKYTDEKNYELIFVDVIPKIVERDLNWWDGYNILRMGERDDRRWYKIYEIDEGDPGQYACYNLGFKKAKGDYICIFQNDVFAHEGWLDSLKYYLDNDLLDVVMPDQYPKTRQEMLDAYSLKVDYDNVKASEGVRDAGLFLFTREAYKKIGGWNEEIRTNYGEKDMFQRFDGGKLRHMATKKCPILHLKHGTGWIKGKVMKDVYQEDNRISSTIIQQDYNERKGRKIK